MAGAASTPMHFEISVRGVAQIHNDLSKKNQRFVRRLQRIVKTYGETTRALVQFLAPVDTAFMQQNVKTFYSADGLSFEVGWDVMDFVNIGQPFYPVYQELGTERMSAQPSLMPAFQDQHPLFAADVYAAAYDEWERLGRP